MRNRSWIIIIGLLALLCALAAWRMVNMQQRNASSPTGTMQICVLDGRTLAPIADACVVIPEAGARVVTDKSGRTKKITVPVRTDIRMEQVLQASWGEVTVLVYCPGYYPYALLHCAIRQGNDRNGPTIYLFPDDDSMTEPFCVIESPDPGWVLALIEKYDPNVS